MRLWVAQLSVYHHPRTFRKGNIVADLKLTHVVKALQGVQPIGRADGYDRGYRDGYADGKADGFKIGYEEGREETLDKMNRDGWLS